jgi:hypothetical protein
MAIADDASTGYKFEVTLRIPESLHNKFNNYVPCPENVQVLKKDLNAWQQEEYKESKVRKLCCSFKDKIDYVVDYRYLKLVLSLGVELVSVNRVLQYTQENFLKKYIELNTNLRAKAKNDFEKDFFKLMNNSVFGKTMENVRQRINFRLVSTVEQAMRVKNLIKFTIFGDSLVGVHIQKTKVNLNKPVYLGQTILDDSKCLMYDFHYNFMLKKIPQEDIDLLFTDTDSLCYCIRNHDTQKLMKDNKEYFDLSNYPENHPMYDKTNKCVIGKFKNESPSEIREFVGLRAKLYSYRTDPVYERPAESEGEIEIKYDDYVECSSDEKQLDQCDSKQKEDNKTLKNKCKGVKQYVAKKLAIDKYREVLFSRGEEKILQNGIRSHAHQLYTETVSKVALTTRDDKVYVCDDNIHTRNFGHYLNKYNMNMHIILLLKKLRNENNLSQSFRKARDKEIE